MPSNGIAYLQTEAPFGLNRKMCLYLHKFSFNLLTTNSELFKRFFWESERLKNANVIVYFAKKKDNF